MKPLKLLDLFSGIGGFSLGLERSGLCETVAFCEIEPYPRRVLAKHWPKVPCYDDVRTLTAAQLAADGIAVDAICGGFPCQDISVAGKGAGLAGERSGLWSEIARLVGELRPCLVILENVSALLGRGLGDVLGDLAALGYDAEWHCIPASAIGANHHRDRVWIISRPAIRWDMADTKQVGTSRPPVSRFAADHIQSSNGMAQGWDAGDLADTNKAQRERNERAFGIIAEYADLGGSSWWTVEPDVGRVANGVPARTHRLAALGNAVVPQIPELIGRAILASMTTTRPDAGDTGGTHE